MADAGDWATYNGPLSGARYSPLAQITRENVSKLHRLCAFEAPEVVSLQSGIVAEGGVLYFTAFNSTYAVDGKTCQQKWKHTHSGPDTFLKVNRGLGYADGRLFRGTGDAHALALDAATGKEVWRFETVSAMGPEVKRPQPPLRAQLYFVPRSASNSGAKGPAIDSPPP